MLTSLDHAVRTFRMRGCVLTFVIPHYTVQTLPFHNIVKDQFSVMPRFASQDLNTLPGVRTVSHQCGLWRCTLALLTTLLIAPHSVNAAAAAPASANDAEPKTTLQNQCLPGQDALLRVRLNGSINHELSWDASQLNCAGSVRPDTQGGKGGLRLRFSARGNAKPENLVMLFGITGLREGADGKALPANLTIMIEGKGEFYATQGDNKCTVDEIHQTPLQGIPLRQRAYQVSARGFCTQPARALNGEGSVLVSRFDFVGRVDFSSDDSTDPVAGASRRVSPLQQNNP